MSVRIRSSLASGKIRTALFLALVTATIVITGRDAILGQTGSGTAAQAPLFTVIDLHPDEFGWSVALGVSGDQQVGAGAAPPGGEEHALLWHSSGATVVDLFGPSRGLQATAICGGQQVGYGDVAGVAHALLWRGSAASTVDLNPSGFEGSGAFGTSGGQQVGEGNGHALLWRGTAATVVDLHPHGFASSEAHGTDGEEQVGWGDVPRNGRNYHHALLWHGSAASVVDLHPRGFNDSEAHGTAGGQQVGHGSGPATGAISDSGVLAETFHDHAVLWHGGAASVVDLNPPGFDSSSAYATNGAEQVGVGDGPVIRDEAHALLWRGSAARVVDLHTFLPPGFVHSVALAIDAAGDIVGSASHVTGPSGDSHAILWKRNASRPGTPRGHSATGC